MKDTNTDAFGNYHDEDGRLIVAERPRTDGRKLKYRRSTRVDRDIAQDYSDGDLTVTRIAEIYGTSHCTVRRVALNHGVPMRTPALSFSKTNIDVDKALSLRQLGFSIAEIAEFLGQTSSSVASLFTRKPEAKLTHTEAVKRRKAELEGPYGDGL